MNPYSEDHGLVFRSFVYLFKVLQEHEKCNFVLKASFLEIYNEKVIDLLNPGTSRKPLAVRWSKKTRGFFVENLFTVECEELDDLLAVLEEGMKNRSIGTHNMNEYSSRSHSILTVNITSEQAMENGVFISKQGKINFVDLAGSEMTKKTQSEGKTLEEANNINKSLMVLGYCISSLSDGKRKSGHIPYRDSKLTKLLADSLAGNGVSLMIACVSPARSNASETLNTLRYAARAKKIATKPYFSSAGSARSSDSQPEARSGGSSDRKRSLKDDSSSQQRSSKYAPQRIEKRKTDTRDPAAGGSRQTGRDGELGAEPVDPCVHHRERGAATRERGALCHAGPGDTGPGTRLPGKREAAQKTGGRELSVLPIAHNTCETLVFGGIIVERQQ